MVKKLAEKLLDLVLKLLIDKLEELLNTDLDGDGKIGK